MWLSLRSLRGLKFDTAAVPLAGGDFSIRSSEQIFWRDAMPIYISRGRFTSDAVKGMVAKPENREELSPNSSRVSEASSSGGT